MAKFLTTSWVSSYIEDIIKKAQQEVYLVSPYLQFSQSFYERLQDAQDHNVKIKIVYGKSELNQKETQLLAGLSNLTLYYSNNLHAKCYFNETEMVITSMNMYEYSEKNNREMGVHITKRNDLELYQDALKETESIIRSADLIYLTAKKAPKTTQNTKPKKEKTKSSFIKKFQKKKALEGTCIRCETTIPFDLERPYCYDCFNIWSQFENPEYEEYACHKCGKENYSSMIKPVCYSCYKSLN